MSARCAQKSLQSLKRILDFSAYTCFLPNIGDFCGLCLLIGR